MKSAATFLSKEEQIKVTDAIKDAEKTTSGEIRVHLEAKCADDPLDRAAYLFDKLNMQKTELRNGVLFYLAFADRKFAIIGDAGINKVTEENFWDKIKETMMGFFKQEQFAEGLATGIKMAGEALKVHFPYQTDDENELSDDISFGK